MSIDIDNKPAVYNDIIWYLESMNIPDGATQQIRTRITHNSHSYTLIGRLFYFCGKDDIFRCVVKKAVVSNLLREFYEGFCGEHFPRRGPVENFLRRNSIGRQYSMTFFCYCKRCKVCQAFTTGFTVSNNLLPIRWFGPFKKWDITLISLLPVIKRGHRFIVVATDYLTKFAEVRAFKTSVG